MEGQADALFVAARVDDSNAEVSRLDRQGNLNADFGSEGTARIRIYDVVSNLKGWHPEVRMFSGKNRLYVTGYRYSGKVSRTTLVALDQRTGAVDESFSGLSKWIESVDFSERDSKAYVIEQVKALANGRIVLGGIYTGYKYPASYLLITAMEANGDPIESVDNRSIRRRDYEIWSVTEFLSSANKLFLVGTETTDDNSGTAAVVMRVMN